MNLYNYNEMFILALVALSIIGVVCLGLLIVLALFVLGQKREGEQKENPPINTTEIIKELRKSSAITNASFMLAIVFFVASNFAVIATKPYMIIIGGILLLWSIVWAAWNIGKWRYP